VRPVVLVYLRFYLCSSPVFLASALYFCLLVVLPTSPFSRSNIFIAVLGRPLSVPSLQFRSGLIALSSFVSPLRLRPLLTLFASVSQSLIAPQGVLIHPCHFYGCFFTFWSTRPVPPHFALLFRTCCRSITFPLSSYAFLALLSRLSVSASPINAASFSLSVYFPTVCFHQRPPDARPIRAVSLSVSSRL